jgi:hypothetical protein
MTDETIVRFPVKTWQRIKNRRGKHSVSCMVTDRWLRFDKKATKVDFGIQTGTAVFVDVMTDTSGEPRKVCQVCITLEDLREVLKRYEQ